MLDLIDEDSPQEVFFRTEHKMTANKCNPALTSLAQTSQHWVTLNM